MLAYHKQIDKRTTMKNQNRSAALGPAMKLLGGLQLVCGRPTLALSSALVPQILSCLVCIAKPGIGKRLSKDGKKNKKTKKNTNNIKLKFELQTFNLHQIIQRELMIGFFL